MYFSTMTKTCNTGQKSRQTSFQDAIVVKDEFNVFAEPTAVFIHHCLGITKRL